MESPIKMDDLEVPLFLETHKCQAATSFTLHPTSWCFFLAFLLDGPAQDDQKSLAAVCTSKSFEVRKEFSFHRRLLNRIWSGCGTQKRRERHGLTCILK